MVFTDKRELKDKIIAFKVTETQKNHIQDMAKERGMTVTDMLLILLENENADPQIKILKHKK